MPTGKGLGPWATRSILLILLLSVAALGLHWVYLVPIFQAPDEPYHLDYALAIHQKGGLFRIQGPPPPGARMVHPYTHYLMDRTALQAVAFHPEAKLPPGYGLPAFDEMLESECPSPESVPMTEATGLAWVYPFGYYALLAAWMAFLSWLSNSLLVLFFGARILSVLLLMASLLCVYGTARELGYPRRFSLLLTGIIGLFPMTLFVASYVQPDNLSFTLVSVCFYLTLVVRRRPDHDWIVGLLGLAFGALLVTKQHYYACTLLPALALLASVLVGAGFKRWIKSAVLLMAPSLGFGALYLWTVWDATNYYSGTAAHENLVPFLFHGFRKALQDFYTGTTHRSFWGIFGWMDTPLVIGTPWTSAVMHTLIRLGSWTILVLTLVRLKQVLTRALGWYRRGKRWRAVRVLLANPVLNSFFLFTVLMFVLYIRLANRFGAQGRNWLPYLMPVFLTGIVYAPKALRPFRHRAAFSSVILAFLALYGIVGNYYAFQTIQARYYDPRNEQPMEQIQIPVAEAKVTPIALTNAGSDRSFQVFALKKPAYVYALRIRYTLPVTPSDSIPFQLFWRNQVQNPPAPVSYQQSYDWQPQPLEKTLYVWVNDTMDEWGIRVEGVEGPLILRDVVLYRQPEAVPAKAPPPPGSHSVRRPGFVQWQDEH
jgi:hypothetical protein